MGEPRRRRPPAPAPRNLLEAWSRYFSPLAEFFRRRGASWS